jgi:hypothetical protein
MSLVLLVLVGCPIENETSTVESSVAEESEPVRNASFDNASDIELGSAALLSSPWNIMMAENFLYAGVVESLSAYDAGHGDKACPSLSVDDEGALIIQGGCTNRLGWTFDGQARMVNFWIFAYGPQAGLDGAYVEGAPTAIEWTDFEVDVDGYGRFQADGSIAVSYQESGYPSDIAIDFGASLGDIPFASSQEHLACSGDGTRKSPYTCDYVEPPLAQIDGLGAFSMRRAGQITGEGGRVFLAADDRLDFDPSKLDEDGCMPAHIDDVATTICYPEQLMDVFGGGSQGSEYDRRSSAAPLDGAATRDRRLIGKRARRRGFGPSSSRKSFCARAAQRVPHGAFSPAGAICSGG